MLCIGIFSKRKSELFLLILLKQEDYFMSCKKIMLAFLCVLSYCFSLSSFATFCPGYSTATISLSSDSPKNKFSSASTKEPRTVKGRRLGASFQRVHLIESIESLKQQLSDPSGSFFNENRYIQEITGLSCTELHQNITTLEQSLSQAQTTKNAHLGYLSSLIREIESKDTQHNFTNSWNDLIEKCDFNLQFNYYQTSVEVRNLETTIDVCRLKISCNERMIAQHVYQEQLVQIKENFKGLDQQLQCDSIQQTLKAIDQTIADKGLVTQAYHQLTPQAKELLNACAIAPEKFESMNGTAFQNHLFKETCQTLERTAQLKLTDAQIYEYALAITKGCDAALNIIKTGAPEQAIATTQMVSCMYKVAKIMEGVALGAFDGIKSSLIAPFETILHPLQAIEGLQNTCKVLINILKLDPAIFDAFKKEIEIFKQLPIEQQARHVSSIVASFAVPLPTTLVHKIPGFEKILQRVHALANNKIEKAIAKVEHVLNAESKTAAEQRISQEGMHAVAALDKNTKQNLPVKATNAIEKNTVKVGGKAESTIKSTNSAAGKSQACKGPVGTYDNASYHKLQGNSLKSRRPTDGQNVLDNSVLYKEKGNTNYQRRLGYEGEYFVVLDETEAGKRIFHGHVRSWEGLHEKMRTFLKNEGLTNDSGKILRRQWKT